MSNKKLVWPYTKGTERGQAIEPLYSSVVEACISSPDLHELLELVDALRVRRVCERKLAKVELKMRILDGR